MKRKHEEGVVLWPCDTLSSARAPLPMRVCAPHPHPHAPTLSHTYPQRAHSHIPPPMASVVAKDNFRPVMADSKVVSARAIAVAAATAAALQRQQQQQQQQQKPKGINCIFNLEDYKWGENERPLIAHDEF